MPQTRELFSTMTTKPWLGWQLPATETLVAVILVAVATVVGAWLARRGSGRSAMLLAAASGILLIIAVLDLLPDAWEGAHGAGVPLWAVPVTALASYAAVGVVVRIGCRASWAVPVASARHPGSPCTGSGRGRLWR
ncbi:hypothetical protein [Streptomyces barringtoniae]|uniref:hypothetical protein n=1 Tax=Streptomyces barringtoniae TaxID=2892029 RepID=UPI001E549141|nr:hypothetical protein [Streptomyces barringtoniae]MCC5481088.1 hypothetical protein [Streptomyces barringtoniae]